MSRVSGWGKSISAASPARCLAYVPEAIVGDYAIVHAGFAIGIVDEEEAARTLELTREIQTQLADEDES